jgi:hypothetical protein
MKNKVELIVQFNHGLICCLHYDDGLPLIKYYVKDEDHLIIHSIDIMIGYLNDPDFLTNRSFQYFGRSERCMYIDLLSDRDDLTETQKRLLKMYQSKLTTDVNHNG